MSNRWIVVVYKCHCMPKEMSVPVLARDLDEHIIIFMDRVKRSLGRHHMEHCPICTRTEMEYAKIPIDDDQIGVGKNERAN